MSVPQFVFLATEPPLCEAWKTAIRKYYGTDGDRLFSVQQGRLNEIDAGLLANDCMVSPANSFGLMDGGYDLALSRAFMGTTGDLARLTHHVQRALRRRWRGFAPPQSCTLVALPGDVAGAGGNPWGARVLAVLPTMRVPERVGWHRDLVYNSMWTLLVEVLRWNDAHAGDAQIRRVLMTGLATGTGELSVARCAAQMVLAVKHFEQGWPEEPTWKDVGRASQEVHDTTEL